MNAMTRWNPLGLGLLKVASPISAPSDRVLLSAGVRGKLARRALRALPKFGGVLSRHLRTSDLVHAHFLTDATLIVTAAQMAKCPLVITVHGTDVTTVGRLGGLSPRSARHTLERAAAVITVSDFLYAHARALGVREDKLHRIYTGIPVRDMPKKTIEKTWDVVFVGRLIDKKGARDALEATNLASRQADRVLRIAMVGDGPELSPLRAWGDESGLEVDWLGHRSPDEVWEVLNQSRVFVGPSRTGADGGMEGLGMVYLEAAAAGLPVVAYRHGGVPEAVVHGETGFLATEGDVAGLADYLERLLTDDTLSCTLGDAGRRRIEQEFDIKKQTAKLEELYDLVAEYGG